MHHIEIGSQHGCDLVLIEDMLALATMVLHGRARARLGRIKAVNGHVLNRLFIGIKPVNIGAFQARLRAMCQLSGHMASLQTVDWREEDGVIVARVKYPEPEATHAEILAWASWMLAFLVHTREIMSEEYRRAA